MTIEVYDETQQLEAMLLDDPLTGPTPDLDADAPIFDQLKASYEAKFSLMSDTSWLDAGTRIDQLNRQDIETEAMEQLATDITAAKVDPSTIDLDEPEPEPEPQIPDEIYGESDYDDEAERKAQQHHDQEVLKGLVRERLEPEFTVNSYGDSGFRFGWTPEPRRIETAQEATITPPALRWWERIIRKAYTS